MHQLAWWILLPLVQHGKPLVFFTAYHRNSFIQGWKFLLPKNLNPNLIIFRIKVFGDEGQAKKKSNKGDSTIGQ